MFVFYSEAADAYWIMPSADLVSEATCNKEGKHAGKYTIVFTNGHSDGRAHPRPRFDAWRGNWSAFDAMAHSLAGGAFAGVGPTVVESQLDVRSA